MYQNVSFQFTHAIARIPGDNCIFGVTTADLGDPDPELFREQHVRYVSALQLAGVDVTVLAADERFPDSVFVEDPVLCLPEAAIILTSGAPSRQGEAEALEPVIRSFFGDRLMTMSPGARVDGGDILVTDREILIGLSERTNSYGVNELSELVKPWGYPVRAVDTPSGVLHLKTDCATLGIGTILTTKRLARSGVFHDYEVILVPDGEEAAANAVRINDTVLLAEGFVGTADALSAAGFAVECLPVSEARKLDGGLSCMSLRFKTS